MDLAGLAGTATNPFVVWLITTSGGLLLFLFFLRRTRDDDLVLARRPPAVNTAVAEAVMAAASAAVDTRVDPKPTGRETMLPPTPPRTFAKPPATGVERATIGYRRVRISSKPDAIRSVERGRLDRGDEVEIIDSYEGFLEVRTPDGITGWILRHTIIG